MGSINKNAPVMVVLFQLMLRFIVVDKKFYPTIAQKYKDMPLEMLR
jgi:hypothetical protein